MYCFPGFPVIVQVLVPKIQQDYIFFHLHKFEMRIQTETQVRILFPKYNQMAYICPLPGH
jgi:hypothetical protein